jgi:hypothetical protein
MERSVTLLFQVGSDILKDSLITIRLYTTIKNDFGSSQSLVSISIPPPSAKYWTAVQRTGSPLVISTPENRKAQCKICSRRCSPGDAVGVDGTGAGVNGDGGVGTVGAVVVQQKGEGVGMTDGGRNGEGVGPCEDDRFLRG